MIPIETSKAPAPLGPYSQGVVAPKGAQLLFVSGQLPIDPLSGELVNGKIEPLTEQVIKNTQQILIEGGSDLEKVLRVEIFLIDLKGDYHRLNEVYGKYFNTPPYPARQVVQVVELPMGSRLEMSCIAYC